MRKALQFHFRKRCALPQKLCSAINCVVLAVTWRRVKERS